MRYFPLFLLSILLWSGCEPAVETPPSNNKFDDAELVSIYTFQDERKTDSLLPFLKHENPGYREEAAMAFGSVQDTLAIPQLIEVLQDSVEAVRIAAAYALGQTRDSAAAPALLNAIDGSPILLSSALQGALGKTGTQVHLDQLLQKKLRGASFYRSLYYFGLRGISSSEAQSIAVKGLGGADSDASLYAGAYLGRLKEIDTAQVRRMMLNWGIVTNKEAASHAIRACRHLPGVETNDFLGKELADPESDYRIRVNAASALHFIEGSSAWTHLKNGLHAKEVQVQVAAAEKILKNPSFFPFDSLWSQAQNESLHWRPSALLYQAAVKQAMRKANPNYEQLDAELYARFEKSPAPYEKGNFLMALANDPKHHNLAVEVMETSEIPALKSYAMMGLSSLYQMKNPFTVEQRIEVLKKGISTGDVAVMAIAASELQGKDTDYKGAIDDLNFLDEAMESLTLPRDIEIYHLFEECRNYLAATPDRELTEVPFVNPINWEDVQRISKDARMIMETSKGKIVLQLLVERTPGTVANFVSLAENGFFDGKTIHRVVPNFVAQGGCPRGDGWGSTPETIRSEWPLDYYQRGSVGVASAGKDTESCQFFITHCATPHLDGRYTIFANVIEGMVNADRLEMGDQVVSVKLEGVSAQAQD